MYEEFYELKCRPFEILPDPAFLFWSRNHKLGLSMLQYSLMTHAPLTVITGEIGAGKTTLLRHLLNEMPDDVETVLISNLISGQGSLLEWVMMSLDQPFEGMSHVKLFRKFQDHVVDAFANGRRTLLVFDEAQNFSAATLEEIRMLTNVNADHHALLQIVLVGQPQLRDLVSGGDLVQFAQRVSCDFHIDTLSQSETREYILHRLMIAGRTSPLFEESTFGLIHAATRGIPRVINTLCDLCLVYGYSDEAPIITIEMLREALGDVERRGIFGQFSRNLLQNPPEASVQTLPVRTETRSRTG